MDNQFSEEAFIEFLGYLASKNLLNSSTASARKAAVAKILSAADDDEKQDLRNLDKDLLFQRFANKHGRDFTPESLVTYKSRFNAAFADFISYKNNPSGFRVGKGRKTFKEKNGVGKKNAEKFSESSPKNLSPPNFSFDTKAYVLQIPISNGTIIEVRNLPLELTAGDATKIAAIIQAHVINTEQTPK